MNLTNETDFPTKHLRSLLLFVAKHRDYTPPTINVKKGRGWVRVRVSEGRFTLLLPSRNPKPEDRTGAYEVLCKEIVHGAAIAFEAMRLRKRERVKGRTISTLGDHEMQSRARWRWREGHEAAKRTLDDFVREGLSATVTAILSDAEYRDVRAVARSSRAAKANTLREKITVWTRKKKLAETYLKKYTRALRRYESGGQQ